MKILQIKTRMLTWDVNDSEHVDLFTRRTIVIHIDLRAIQKGLQPFMLHEICM